MNGVENSKRKYVAVIGKTDEQSETFTGHVTATSAECVLTLAFGTFQNFPVLPCTKPESFHYPLPPSPYMVTLQDVLIYGDVGANAHFFKIKM